MSGNRFNLADYIPVDERIDAYWKEYTTAHGSIQTDIVWVNNDGTSVAIKATVCWDERVVATGIAQEDKGNQGANRTSWWENAETSAIGRALANMGMSLSRNRPSREEMEKVERGVAKNGAYEAVLSQAWALAEAGRPVAAVKDWLNQHRHSMDKEQRQLALAELAKIQERYYAVDTPAPTPDLSSAAAKEEARQTAGV